jgi:hypothetical protein
MGYYSGFEYALDNARVDKEKVKGLEEFFTSDNKVIYGFWNVKIEYDEEGKLQRIKLLDYYAKFYDDRLFAQKLSEVLVDGKVKLYFTGEDGENWGYEVYPDRAVEMFTIWVNEYEYPEVKKFLETLHTR